MSHLEELKAHVTAEAQTTRKYLADFLTGYVGPGLSDIKDLRQQETGGRDAGQYPGHPQIDNRTQVDALAAIGASLDLPGFVDPHGGSLKAQQEEAENG